MVLELTDTELDTYPNIKGTTPHRSFFAEPRDDCGVSQVYIVNIQTDLEKDKLTSNSHAMFKAFMIDIVVDYMPMAYNSCSIHLLGYIIKC